MVNHKMSQILRTNIKTYRRTYKKHREGSKSELYGRDVRERVATTWLISARS